MKLKFTFSITLVLIFLNVLRLPANNIVVDVEDFEFDPAIITINAGDTVTWLWDEGTHTTTSTLIPAGAAPWDHAIDQSNLFFSYQFTVAGSYDYQCSFHSSMGMQGHVTVLGSVGIAETAKPALNIENIQYNNGNVIIGYNLNKRSGIEISLHDLTGKTLQHLVTEPETGQHSITLATGIKSNTIIIADILCGNERITKKVFAE